MLVSRWIYHKRINMQLRLSGIHKRKVNEGSRINSKKIPKKMYGGSKSRQLSCSIRGAPISKLR